MASIYLDHNATTTLHRDVVEALLTYLTTHFGNPSSGHEVGLRARAAVEAAREQVASLLGCSSEEVVFTSGGTESNNLALRGLTATHAGAMHVLTSAVEHPAIEMPCRQLERQNVRVTRVAVDSFGRVDPGAVVQALERDTVLVTVMLANNETGTLMGVREIAHEARARGVIVHTDAAQAVGKVPTRVADLGVDMLSIAGHKLYAPKGVGALYLRKGIKISPLLFGAGHERGMRPGTENVASIVGLGAACALAERDGARQADRQRGLRDKLWELLKEKIPGLSLNGHPSERLPNTLNVSFPGVKGSEVLARAQDVAASTGSACHAGSETPSTILKAMGISDAVALGAVRLSLGRETSEDDIVRAAASLVHAYDAAAKA